MKKTEYVVTMVLADGTRRRFPVKARGWASALRSARHRTSKTVPVTDWHVREALADWASRELMTAQAATGMSSRHGSVEVK